MYILDHSSPVNYADDKTLLSTGETLMKTVEHVKNDIAAVTIYYI